MSNEENEGFLLITNLNESFFSKMKVLPYRFRGKPALTVSVRVNPAYIFTEEDWKAAIQVGTIAK